MVKHFKKKFEEKTDQELLQILNNREAYEEEAVQAVKSLLEWRKSMDIEIVTKPQNQDQLNTLEISSFNPKLFLMQWSKKDFFTVFSTGLLWVAILQIINLYGNEPYFKHLSIWFTLLLMIFIFILNHIFYKIDHQRSNNYAGRVLQSVITLICFILITSVINSLRELKLSFSVGSNNIINLIAFLTFILFIEILIGILKRFFKFIKWEIL